MRKTFIVTASLLLAPLAAPQPAMACSCIYYEDANERFQAFYDNADIIVQAIPIESAYDDGRQVHYSVSVEKVWKGKTDAYIDIATALDSAACGINLRLDDRVIIFATNGDGQYSTGLCSGTVPVEDAGDLIAWLNTYGETTKEPETNENPEEACTPYMCVNGDVFPRCENDYVINYLVNPCQFSGGEGEPKEEIPVEKDYFSDVFPTHPYFEAISFVRSEGIVTGYEDGTYRPEQYINRAEFTKIIVGANFRMEAIDRCPLTTDFSDVTLSDWFAKYVCTAKHDGIIDGYPDATFRPGSYVNFAEASKIVVGAFGIQTGATTNNEVWWRPYVLALARINGLPSSFSDPNQQLTRGDMAEIIYRVMMGMES